MPYSSNSRGRRRRGGYIAALVVALLLATFAIPALASSHKTFTAEADPAMIVSGEVTEFVFKIKNTSQSTQLGSANIVLPSGVDSVDVESLKVNGQPRSLPSVGEHEGEPAILLRDLAAPVGATIAVEFDAEVTCSGDQQMFQVYAKQANNFQGPPGNNLSPIPAEVPLTCWEAASECDDAGICVVFSPDRPDMTVTIVGQLKEDPDDAGAFLEGTLYLSILDDVDLDCGDDYLHAPHTTLFDVENSEAFVEPLMASIRIHAGEDVGSASDYQVCFEGDQPFYDRDGEHVVTPGNGVFGPALLHDCPGPTALSGAPDSIYPCVSEWENHKNGDREVRFLLPAADPRFK